MTKIPSPATDAVLAANHPSHADGGPCDGCAFRRGTEAENTLHTVALARACVEGLRPFYCHEHPGLCRGFVAAANLRGTPQDEDDRHWVEVNALFADALGEAVAMSKEEDERIVRLRGQA